MNVLAEGVESLKLACSLVLLIPAIGVALLGRRRNWLVPAWIVTVTLVAWLRFTGWFTPLATGVWHVIAGLLLLVVAVIAWRRNELATDLLATSGVAFLAAWTWQPCVGRQLGDILNNARAEPWAELGPTFLYLVGLFVPLILVAALDVAWPKFGETIELQWVRTLGLGIIVLVGATVAVTLFDDLASWLVQHSSF